MDLFDAWGTGPQGLPEVRAGAHLGQTLRSGAPRVEEVHAASLRTQARPAASAMPVKEAPTLRYWAGVRTPGPAHLTPPQADHHRLARHRGRRVHGVHCRSRWHDTLRPALHRGATLSLIHISEPTRLGMISYA